jgi:secretion/DNA translocation related TadE-like protein
VSRSDRDASGVASVLVVALTGLLVLLGLTAAFLVATVAAHRRVQAAADLAALAGATTAQPGGGGAASSLPSDPCAVAAQIAVANGARLTSCRVEVSDVLVTAALDGPRFAGHSWALTAQARAGPGSSG